MDDRFAIHTVAPQRTQRRIRIVHISHVHGFHRLGRHGPHHSLIRDERVPERSSRQDALRAFACRSAVDRSSDSDWQKTAAELKKQQPEIIGAAPFLRGQGLLTSGTNVRGVQLNGIDPETDSQVSDVAKNMKIGQLSDLKPGEFKIILGTDLARMLGVIPGERST